MTATRLWGPFKMTVQELKHFRVLHFWPKVKKESAKVKETLNVQGIFHKVEFFNKILDQGNSLLLYAFNKLLLWNAEQQEGHRYRTWLQALRGLFMRRFSPLYVRPSNSSKLSLGVSECKRFYILFYLTLWRTAEQSRKYRASRTMTAGGTSSLWPSTESRTRNRRLSTCLFNSRPETRASFY